MTFQVFMEWFGTPMSIGAGWASRAEAKQAVERWCQENRCEGRPFRIVQLSATCARCGVNAGIMAGLCGFCADDLRQERDADAAQPVAN